MSDTEHTPLADRDDDYHEQRESLIEQTIENREQDEQKHQALLEAAAEGEEAVIEAYEVVEIGTAELTVKTQIEGKVYRKLDQIYEGDLSPGRTLDVYIDVLTEQTQSIEAGGVTVESRADVRRFFRDFIDSNDAEAAAQLALERVVEQPNDLEEKRKQEAMQSFPESQNRQGVWKHRSKRS